MNFVFKTVAGSPASGPERVTTLDDETRDNPVKREPVIKLARCQIQEICSRHRSFGGKGRRFDVSFGRVNDNPNIFEHWFNLHCKGRESKRKLNGEEFTKSALRRELFNPSTFHA